MAPTTIVVAAASSRNALGVHVWHAVEATGFLLVSLIGISVSEWRRHRRESSARGTTAAPRRRLGSVHCSAAVGSVALGVMAIAGAGAAAVHYVVMPTHFGESTLYGSFFLIAATAQLVYSLLLVLRSSRLLITVGVLGNLSMVALWLATRLVAIPLGPDAGSTESFGGLDILASSFEAIVVIAGVLTLIQAGGPGVKAVRGLLRKPAVAGFAVLATIAVTATACAAPPT